ncbi:MAG: hypothetical protein K6B65_05190 [Bacilli bacterium]|nr:hypothetical protein [Bacilli bacterium]
MPNLQLKCPCCGGTLEFDNASQDVVCPFCDSHFSPDELKEYSDAMADVPQEDTSWDESQVQAFTTEEKEGIKIYSCDSCGGEIMVEETTSSTICPYCGNNLLVAKELSGDLKPNRVIPFKNDKETVQATLKKFFKKKILLPSSFSKDSTIEEIKPLYVPFWVFDADVDGVVNFKGEKYERWSDSQYDYKKVKYYSIVRGGHIAFDHIPVDGSKKMEDELMESIEPFDFSEAVEFNAAYLAGFAADRYDVSKDETFTRATQRCREGTEIAFEKDVVGYSNVRVDNSNLKLSNTNALYALYPVWLLNTKWKDKNYRFAVNGQTDKIAGNLPISPVRAILIWLLPFLIIAGAFIGIMAAVNSEDLVLGILFGILSGAIVATVILVLLWRINKNVRFQVGASSYTRPNSLNIDYRRSFFLYSKTTKTRRQSESNRKK